MFRNDLAAAVRNLGRNRLSHALALGLALVFGGAIYSAALAAEKKSEPPKCVAVPLINGVLPVDDTTMLIEMKGTNGYRLLHLKNACSADDGSLQHYEISSPRQSDFASPRLCVDDTVRFSKHGAACVVAKIAEIDEAEATALRTRHYSTDPASLDQALADAEKDLAANPSNAQAVVLRAWAFMQKRDYPEAIKGFTRALELDPADVQSLENRGTSHDRYGEYKEALADYRRVLELAPAHAQISSMIETLEKLVRNTEAAEEDAAAAGDCGPLRLYGAVDMHGLPNGIKIAGSMYGSPREFGIDIKYAVGIIRETLAAELELVRIRLPDRSNSVAGQAVTESTVPNAVMLGDTAMPRIEFAILADPPWRDVNVTVGNLLLHFVDVEFDFAAAKMRLFLPHACAGQSAVYWAKTSATLPFHPGADGAPVFIVEIDGKKVEATLDTANADTTLDEEVAKSVFKVDDLADYRFHSMSATDFRVNNPQIRFRPAPPGACRPKLVQRSNGAYGFLNSNVLCSALPPLTLGVRHLSRLRLYIAAKENTIYFTGAGE